MDMHKQRRKPDLLKSLISAIDQLSDSKKRKEAEYMKGDYIDSNQIIHTKAKIIFEIIKQIMPTPFDPINAHFSMFLSWSSSYKDGHNDIHNIVTKIANRRNVSVKTGRMGGGDTSLIGNIRKQIESADMLLCIMTPEKPGVDVEPSPWLVAEVAMAAAFSKPFTIIVHENIAEKYWEEITGKYYHIVCSTTENFDKELERFVDESISHLFKAAIRERLYMLEGYQRW